MLRRSAPGRAPCPADAKVASGTTCRASAGACDRPRLATASTTPARPMRFAPRLRMSRVGWHLRCRRGLRRSHRLLPGGCEGCEWHHLPRVGRHLRCRGGLQRVLQHLPCQCLRADGRPSAAARQGSVTWLRAARAAEPAVRRTASSRPAWSAAPPRTSAMRPRTVRATRRVVRPMPRWRVGTTCRASAAAATWSRGATAATDACPCRCGAGKRASSATRARAICAIRTRPATARPPPARRIRSSPSGRSAAPAPATPAIRTRTVPAWPISRARPTSSSRRRLVCRPGSGDVCDPDEFCTGRADRLLRGRRRHAVGNGVQSRLGRRLRSGRDVHRRMPARPVRPIPIASTSTVCRARRGSATLPRPARGQPTPRVRPTPSRRAARLPRRRRSVRHRPRSATGCRTPARPNSSSWTARRAPTACSATARRPVSRERAPTGPIRARSRASATRASTCASRRSARPRRRSVPHGAEEPAVDQEQDLQRQRQADLEVHQGPGDHSSRTSPIRSTTADYALCIYAGPSDTLVASINVPPSTKWSTLSTKGYKYLDLSLTYGGTQKIILKGTGVPGKTKALLEGPLGQPA